MMTPCTCVADLRAEAQRLLAEGDRYAGTDKARSRYAADRGLSYALAAGYLANRNRRGLPPVGLLLMTATVVGVVLGFAAYGLRALLA